MEAETHQVHAQLQKECDSGKGTGAAYERHDYQKWWKQDQFNGQQADPLYPVILDDPPMATKVMHWLKNRETEHNKLTPRDGGEILNITVGLSSVQQAINTMEQHCAVLEWQYPGYPEVHKKLCDDPRIREIENMARMNEVARDAQAITLKAAGSSSSQ
ncbi:hypothetical protein L218DRAFT_1005663 [Marasmius fiardii PR-910]|nr:hypothetical protein L218DRAFT_1005663 [Marasmius fiardii PR-910]